MSDRRVEITIAGVKLIVPIYKSKAQTLQIAKQLNQRIRAIEEQSNRIDTQRFALEAGMWFATELAKARDGAVEQEAGLIKILERIGSSLTELIDEASVGLE